MHEIILADFKFGGFPQDCQFAKLKTLPKFPAIRYCLAVVQFFWYRSGALYNIQGFLKLTKSCSHFSKILPTTATLKAGCIGNNGIGYSVQGLQ